MTYEVFQHEEASGLVDSAVVCVSTVQIGAAVRHGGKEADFRDVAVAENSIGRVTGWYFDDENHNEILVIVTFDGISGTFTFTKTFFAQHLRVTRE